MGIVVSLLVHQWPHSAIVMSICLLAPYLFFFACRLIKRLEFLWDDPSAAERNDAKARLQRQQQQARVAELALQARAKAAEAGGGGGAGQGQGQMSLAARAQKYAPNVHKSLAGPDWQDANKGPAYTSGARGGAGGGAGAGAAAASDALRQRKAPPVAFDGAVRMLEKMGEWKAMLRGKEALAILYVDEPALGGQPTVVDSSVGSRFKLLAASMGGIAFAQMRVDGLLEQLAKEGVRFTQRFPVLHVYVNGKKVDQVGSADIAKEGAMESALLRLAASPPSLEGSTPSALLQSAAFSQPLNPASSRPMRPAGTEEGNVKEISSHAQFEEVLKSAGATLVVVDFTAQWCGPCKKIKGPFQDMAKANPNVVFLQVCICVSTSRRG